MVEGFEDEEYIEYLMTKNDNKAQDDNGGLTLIDVVNHISSHTQRIDKRMDQLEEKIDRNAQKIDANTVAIKEVEKNLTKRIDALEEDLTATMEDSFMIKRHVGIPVATE